jgi:MFS family permease
VSPSQAQNDPSRTPKPDFDVLGVAIIVGIFEEGTGRTFAMAIYVAAWPTGGALALIVSGFFAEYADSGLR